MKPRAYRLMKEWCDTLLSYTVRTKTPYTDGALLCPACHVLHGRVGDLCLPLTLLWSKTGEQHYLDAAERLIDWSEYNLITEDGLWHNDAGNRWIGISAFSALSIGDALLHFGDRLPERIRDKWQSIFLRMVKVISHWDENEKFKPVINYYCGSAAVLALAFRLTGDSDYLAQADAWIARVMECFDGDGLLFGEGPKQAAEDGSHTVDMGYALEESLPLLLRYASLTGKHQEYFRGRMRDHLAFLLPDGAIDNSFGTRHNKWTYWGSRTSDGIIEGLALMADDPVCATACDRVLSLYEKCTCDGLLAMPMADEAGEPTCLHHSFPHAKALAVFLCEAPDDITATSARLPCEDKYGVKTYQSGRLVLVSKGPFRATFSAINVTYLPDFTANGGGSMNLLYKEGYGPVCAATSAHYKPTEPLNQQYLRHTEKSPCMTAQFVVDGAMGCMDKGVSLSTENTAVIAAAEQWQARYIFEENALRIRLTCADGVYHLPLVCSKEQRVTVSEDMCTVTLDRRLTVHCDVPLTVDPQKRVFHQVGGLLYLPIAVHVAGNAELVIE